MWLRPFKCGISWIEEETILHKSSVYKHLGLIATMTIIPEGWEGDSPVSWQEALLTVTPNSTQLPLLHSCPNLKTSYGAFEGEMGRAGGWSMDLQAAGPFCPLALLQSSPILQCTSQAFLPWAHPLAHPASQSLAHTWSLVHPAPAPAHLLHVTTQVEFCIIRLNGYLMCVSLGYILSKVNASTNVYF